jgi:hypothetical protein
MNPLPRVNARLPDPVHCLNAPAAGVCSWHPAMPGYDTSISGSASSTCTASVLHVKRPAAALPLIRHQPLASRVRVGWTQCKCNNASRPATIKIRLYKCMGVVHAKFNWLDQLQYFRMSIRAFVTLSKQKTSRNSGNIQGVGVEQGVNLRQLYDNSRKFTNTPESSNQF